MACHPQRSVLQRSRKPALSSPKGTCGCTSEIVQRIFGSGNQNNSRRTKPHIRYPQTAILFGGALLEPMRSIRNVVHRRREAGRFVEYSSARHYCYHRLAYGVAQVEHKRRPFASKAKRTTFAPPTSSGAVFSRRQGQSVRNDAHSPHPPIRHGYFLPLSS
jgi:hypothetical protein